MAGWHDRHARHANPQIGHSRAICGGFVRSAVTRCRYALSIATHDELLGHPVYGNSWEGFVVDNIVNALPSYAQPFFYRTADGTEIDLVIEMALNRLWAIEIKASHTPKLEHGFHLACDDLSVEEKFVVSPGTDEFPIKNDVTVISLPGLLDKLAALS